MPKWFQTENVALLIAVVVVVVILAALIWYVGFR